MNRYALRSAIVGLGQVGLLFDQEPQRRASGEIWTHFSAYEALGEDCHLVAAVDPDPGRRELALMRDPNIRVFANVEAMISSEELDVVSVCTPESTHLEIAEKLIGRCRGIFLEKPLCTANEIGRAEHLLASCRRSATALRVNYYKRGEPLVIRTREIVGLARIANVAVRYSGPFAAVGSHALNLMLAFAPDAELVSSVLHRHPEGDGYSSFFRTASGAMAQTLYCGPRNDLVFSCEINHSEGMVVVERNLSRLRCYRFQQSDRYAGYRELEFNSQLEASDAARRFVDYLEQICREIRSGNRDYGNADAALATQRLMSEIEETSR